MSSGIKHENSSAGVDVLALKALFALFRSYIV